MEKSKDLIKSLLDMKYVEGRKPSWLPTHRHKKGGLYKEITRGRGYDGHLDISEVASMRVAIWEPTLTPMLVYVTKDTGETLIPFLDQHLAPCDPDVELVVYESMQGILWVRVAELFDDPTRFTRLEGE